MLQESDELRLEFWILHFMTTIDQRLFCIECDCGDEYLR